MKTYTRFLVLCLVLCLSVVGLFACDSGDAGGGETSDSTASNIPTNPIDPTKGLTFTRNDDNTAYGVSDYSGTAKKVYIPETYHGLPVTFIGLSAFYGCEGLTSVTIPSSVTSIGGFAFYGCEGLTSVTIPSSVTSIGNSAFKGCTGLTSITIPSSVTFIGDFAFSGCSGLTGITVSSGISKYHSAGNCLIETMTKTLVFGCKNSVIPTDGSVTSLGFGAFAECKGLTNITIPSSVTTIENSAFKGCTGLTSITIPNSVTTIADDSFCGCRGLTSVTIPDSVTFIDSGAFSDCNKLVEIINLSTLNITAKELSVKEVHTGTTKIVNQNGYLFYTYGDENYLLGYTGTATALTLPASYNSANYEIYNSAFCDCSWLTSVTIPNSVTSIGNSAFKGCAGLTSVTIGSGVTTIGNSAFSGCSGLTSVTIPNSVTSIGEGAFGGCTGLTSVTIGSGVTTIGNSAFSGCSGLTSVTIPNSVTSIGMGSFYACTELVRVTFENIDGWYLTDIYDKRIRGIGVTDASVNAMNLKNPSPSSTPAGYAVYRWKRG